MAQEMHNPFKQKREGPSGPKKPEGIKPREVARLYFIGGLLIFILIAMVLTRWYIKREQAPPRPPSGDPRLRVRMDDDPLGDRLRKLAASFKGGPSEQDFNDEAFLKLLDMVRTEVPLEGAASRAKSVAPEVLSADGESYRGRFVRFTGKPGEFETVELKRKTGERLGTGILATSPSLSPVRLITMEPMTPAAPTEWWSVEGVFVRNVGHPAIPLVLARNVRVVKEPPPQEKPPAAPQGRPKSIEELAAEFTDDKDTIWQQVQKESPTFLSLMSLVRTSLTPEEASKKVVPTVLPEALLADPGKHRGEMVRVYGRLIKVIPEPLEVTTPDNITHVYAGYMLAHPSMARVHFYMPEKPQGNFKTKVYRGELMYDDFVQVEGVFLRLYKYEGLSLDGGEGAPQVAAVLMAKNLRILEQAKFADPRGTFAGLIFGIGGIIAVVVIVVGILSRKYGKGSLRMQMVGLRRQKAAAEGKSIFSGKKVEGLEAKSDPPAGPPATS